MSGEITAQDLALANFLVCSSLGGKAEIIRPSTLHFVAGQLGGALTSKSQTYKAAFAAMWLKKQAPFKNNNLQTALLVGLALLTQEVTAEKFKRFASVVKNTANVKELEQVFLQA